MKADQFPTAYFLKSENKSWHDKVEESMGANAIFSPNYSKEQYIELLQRLHSAHAVLEPTILAFSEINNYKGLEATRRLGKAEILAKDLKAMGASSAPQQLNIELDSIAEAWGAFYVLEGSTLGGAVILKQLKKLGWTENAFGFYDCYGEEIGKLWMQFLSIFEAEVAQHNWSKEEVAKGAVKAYQLYLDTAEVTPA